MTVGLVARLVVLAVLPDQNFPDANAYATMGRELFSLGQARTHSEYMPLYPIWTFLTGGGIGLKLADIGLSVGAVGLVYGLALEIFADRRAARLAALAAAVYPFFLFYATSRLSENLFVFLLTGAFLLLFKERVGWACLCLVLSILTRPAIDLLAPILVLAFAIVVHRHNWVVGGRRLAVYGAIYVILMIPWWGHNYAKYNEFVRLNLGDGLVLYSGNNPLNRSGGGVNYTANEEGYGVVPNDIDYSIVDGIDDPVERNRVMKAAAIAFMKNNPGRVVELAGIKFLRFWRLWPYAPGYQSPWIIAASLLSYGVALLLCGIFAIRFARMWWRPLLPVGLFAAYLTAVHMVTIGSVRYRLPLEPFMIVIAAWTAVRLAEGWGPSRRLADRWLGGFTATENRVNSEK